MTEPSDQVESTLPAEPEHQEQPVTQPPSTPPPTMVSTLPPPPPWQPPPSPPSPWPGWIATGYVGVAGAIAVAIAVLGQTGVWFFEQLAISEERTGPSWLVTAWISTAAVLLFVVPILFFPQRWAALRATGLAWVLAAALLGVLGTLRLIPQPQNELYLAAFALVTGGIAGVSWLVRRTINRQATRALRMHDAALAIKLEQARRSSRAPVDALWLGAAAGLATLAPWIWFGALGGVLETVLAAAAVAGFGALAGTLLGRLWRVCADLPRWKLVLGGGYAAGVTLTLLAASLGASGIQITAMLAVPPLGYAAAALQRRLVRPSGGSTGVLVAVAAFGPLGFADPEEFSLLLENWWPLFAALSALGIALVAGIVLAIVLRNKTLHTWLAALVTAVVAIATFGGYAVAGQPGFHGERLFVVMKSQASLAGIPRSGDRAERIDAVYQRLVRHAEKTQRSIRHELDRLHLGYTPYYLVNGLSVDAGPVVREWLAHRGDVDRVLLDPVLRPVPGEPPGLPVTATTGPKAPRWNLTMVGAPKVWSDHHATGEGIVVGSSDSGVDGTHPALHDGFRGGRDSWYDPWNHTRTPTDYGGHGTHTTGTAVGSHDIGVAPGAKWIGCVNLARNMASPSRYLDCLQFMLAPFQPGQDPFRDGDPARAPHVLNNSWGCPELEGCDAEALEPAVSAFRAAGIFFVASAGNSGPGCGSLTDPPARYTDAFTVAAVNETRRITGFSSRGRGSGGPQPDISAPGEQVLSAVPGGGYASLDGTSMAGPHVVGAVALLWSAVPSLVGDIDRTEKLLASTAKPVKGTSPCGQRATSGAGIVDAYAAIKAARAEA